METSGVNVNSILLRL